MKSKNFAPSRLCERLFFAQRRRDAKNETQKTLRLRAFARDYFSRRDAKNEIKKTLRLRAFARDYLLLLSKISFV